MIDRNTQKVDQKVDGRFCLAVGDNPDIYADSVVVTDLECRLEAAKNALTAVRKGHILETFRGVIREHVAAFASEPETCLLSWREFNHLVDAYNEEGQELGRRSQSAYSDFVSIDGVNIRKGCDTKTGDFRLIMRL